MVSYEDFRGGGDFQRVLGSSNKRRLQRCRVFVRGLGDWIGMERHKQIGVYALVLWEEQRWLRRVLETEVFVVWGE